jgi:hypothetical protein
MGGGRRRMCGWVGVLPGGGGGWIRTECWPVEPGSLWEAELPWEAGPPEKPHRFITPWNPLPFLHGHRRHRRPFRG